MKTSLAAFVFGLGVSGVESVLIQCPPGLDTPENVGLGLTCGGLCNGKGSCASGYKCQKPCEAEKFPSASFAITEMGSPEPEGVCVVAVDENQKMMPGAPIQKDICSDDVQAAAKEAMSQIDKQSNSMKSMQLSQVVQASSQVVNGIKWTFTLSAGLSDCDKTTEFSVCETPVDDSKRDLYQVTLFEQAWMSPRYTLGEWKVMPKSAPAKMSISKDFLDKKAKTLRGAVDKTSRENPVRAAQHAADPPPKLAPLGGSGSIGPAWTYDSSVEKPAGTKDMGGWTEAVYTAEQQERLGVDQMGKKVEQKKETPCMGCPSPAAPMDASIIEAAKKGVPMVLAAAGEAQGCDSTCISQVGLEFHAVVNATKQVVAGFSFDMFVNLQTPCLLPEGCSSGAAGGVLPQCHMTLWVRDWLTGPDGFQLSDWSCDDSVAAQVKLAASLSKPLSRPLLGTHKTGSIGPAWTYDSSVEAPAGEKDMGTWTMSVYTAEQQERLGVDSKGQKVMQLNTTAVTVASANLSNAETNVFYGDEGMPGPKKEAGGLSAGATAAIGVAGAVAAVGLVAAMVVSRRKSRQARGMQMRTQAGGAVQTGSSDYNSPYSVM